MSGVQGRQGGPSDVEPGPEVTPLREPPLSGAQGRRKGTSDVEPGPEATPLREPPLSGAQGRREEPQTWNRDRRGRRCGNLGCPECRVSGGNLRRGAGTGGDTAAETSDVRGAGASGGTLRRGAGTGGDAAAGTSAVRSAGASEGNLRRGTGIGGASSGAGSGDLGVCFRSERLPLWTPPLHPPHPAGEPSCGCGVPEEPHGLSLGGFQMGVPGGAGVRAVGVWACWSSTAKAHRAPLEAAGSSKGQAGTQE